MHLQEHEYSELIKQIKVLTEQNQNYRNKCYRLQTQVQSLNKKNNSYICKDNSLPTNPPQKKSCMELTCLIMKQIKKIQKERPQAFPKKKPKVQQGQKVQSKIKAQSNDKSIVKSTQSIVQNMQPQKKEQPKKKRESKVKKQQKKSKPENKTNKKMERDRNKKIQKPKKNQNSRISIKPKAQQTNRTKDVNKKTTANNPSSKKLNTNNNNPSVRKIQNNPNTSSNKNSSIPRQQSSKNINNSRLSTGKKRDSTSNQLVNKYVNSNQGKQNGLKKSSNRAGGSTAKIPVGVNSIKKVSNLQKSIAKKAKDTKQSKNILGENIPANI